MKVLCVLGSLVAMVCILASIFFVSSALTTWGAIGAGASAIGYKFSDWADA